MYITEGLNLGGGSRKNEKGRLGKASSRRGISWSRRKNRGRLRRKRDLRKHLDSSA